MDLSLSRRERHKADKRGRIKRAAADLFREKGFDATTTREIAERADVAIGTVFTYARDKRELLFLVLNDRLEEIGAEAETTVPLNKPLADQLLHLFRGVYAYFHAERQIALDFLREQRATASDEPGQSEGTRYIAKRRMRFLQYAQDIIVRARAEGRIAKDGPDPEAVSWIVMAIYSLEVRNWLAKRNSTVEGGLNLLRDRFSILVEGLKPLAASEVQPSQRRGGRTSPSRRAPARKRTI